MCRCRLTQVNDLVATAVVVSHYDVLPKIVEIRQQLLKLSLVIEWYR